VSTDEKKETVDESIPPQSPPADDVQPNEPVSESKAETETSSEPIVESEAASELSGTDAGEGSEIEAKEEKRFQIPDETLELNQFVLGRHFSTFPISPNRIDALVQQGFGYATRMQTAILDYGLAQLSACCPLSAGNSRYLPLCLSALERVFDEGLVIIISSTDNLTDLICNDLISFAGGQDLTIMPIKESDGLDAQRSAYNEQVDILVGSAGRIATMLAGESERKCLFLGFCDLNFSQKDPSVHDLLDALKSTQQVFGLYGGPLEEDFYGKLKTFHPSLTMVDFSVAAKEHKRFLVRSSDKIETAVGLALATDRSLAFVCESESQSQALVSALTSVGVTAHLVWEQTNRRTKDKILRQMRSNKVQCLILTEPNVDRNVAAEITLLSIPEKVSSISGFPGTVTWVLAPDEDSTAIDSFNPVALEAPSVVNAQVDRQQRAFDALLKDTSSLSSSLWNPLVEKILNHPDKEALICAALEQFAANARAEGHERIEEISRLESKEERGKPPPKRQKRRNRYRRRR